jgi:hypothetical protein
MADLPDLAAAGTGAPRTRAPKHSSLADHRNKYNLAVAALAGLSAPGAAP